MTLDEDYFSYALFAFYLFKEDDITLVGGDTRITAFHNNLKSALKNEERDEEAVAKIKASADALDIQYIRYSRSLRNTNVFYKVLFLFIIEISMIWFVMSWYMKWGVDDAADFGTFCLKYCCIIALHMMQQPAIINSMKRIEYVMKHPEHFEQRLVPVLICWMKFLTDFSIEIAMTVSTAFENWNVFMIMDFSALIVINYIDLYYSQTLKDDLKKRIVKEGYKMPIVHKEYRVEQMTLCDKVSRWCLFVVNWYYELIYFHFWPYIGLIYSFYFVEHY